MIQKVLILVFSFLLFQNQHAQSPIQIVDSLKKELTKNPKPEQKVLIYSDLTWYYSNIATDSALVYGNKALQLSVLLKKPKITGQVYSDIGSVYLAKGNMILAKKSYLKSLSIRTKLKDADGMASNWSNLGGVFQRQNVLDTAMIYYLKSLKFYENQKNEPNVDFIKNNIAVLYEDMRNFPKAISLYLEVANYRKQQNQNVQLAMVYNNLGNVYKKTKLFRQSERYFNESIVLSTKEGDSLILGNTYNNLGTLYNITKQPEKAISVLEIGQKILQKVNSDFDLALIEFSLANAYGYKKQYQKSKKLYLKSINAMLPLKANEYISTMYLNLIPIYANLNLPDSATYYSEKYKEALNKRVEDQVSLETAELETKYQTEKKEKLLLQKATEVQQKNMLVLLLLVFIVFVALIGYLIYRQQIIKNKQLVKENELNLAITKIETQNKLQEQRLIISRDLHDNIGAQLTFIISSVNTIKYGFQIENSALSSKLERISNFTQSTITELRDTIWAMNSNTISFEDLKLRIFNFVEKAKKAQENIKFTIEICNDLNNMNLTSIVGMNVYRTIQEAINNALKYAESTQIAIVMQMVNSQVEVQISDNGKGFDLENTEFGNGLNNMKKRIKEIGGTLEIVSVLKKGTTVQLNFKNENLIILKND